MADKEPKGASGGLQQAVGTVVVVLSNLFLPLYMIYRSYKAKVPDVLSLNILIPILLLMMFLPLLDYIYSFSAFRAYDMECSYEKCQPNLSVILLISLLIGLLLFMLVALLFRLNY